MKRRPRSAPVSLTTKERVELEGRLHAKDLCRRDFMRIAVVLMLADGATPAQMAEIFRLHPSMIRRYRKRFERQRLIGLLGMRRPRLPRKYGPRIDQRIRDIIAEQPPGGRRCWTAKLVANRLEGVSYHYVWSFIRKQHINLCTGSRRRKFLGS